MVEKAKGHRGSWFATVKGEKLPCIHRHWLTGLEYADPGYEDTPKFAELVTALKDKGKAVLTNDEYLGDHAENHAFRRTGYIAVFAISDVTVGDGHLKLRLTERLEDLA